MKQNIKTCPARAILVSFLTLALSFLLGACGAKVSPSESVSQRELNALAADLEVRYRHLANYQDARCEANAMGGNCYQASLSFTSSKTHPIEGWVLYFSHITPIRDYESDDLHVEHVNGDLHRITPKENFTGFIAGQTKQLKFYAAGRTLSAAAIMPNYFLSADGAQAVVIDSTRAGLDEETGLETLPFVVPLAEEGSAEGPPKSSRDRTQWATSGMLYEENSGLVPQPESLRAEILPTPLQVQQKPGAPVDLSVGVKVSYLQVEPAQVSAALARLADLGVPENAEGMPLELALDATSEAPSGSYFMRLSADGIVIRGADAAGVFYGLQSLAALLLPGDTRVPRLEIEDRPHYEFRGLHLDVARNFHSKASVLKLLDQMAAYKLNKLHLHLADDEGWRLEIAGLPELTDIGGKRCFDPSETTCLLPFLGAGPDPNTAVNGYYSIADYQEILRAASARHIQVIPSLDMPGHSRAAIVAMLARYNKYRAQGDIETAQQYLLNDLEDRSQYRSIQNYNDNTLNVCMPSTFAFIEKVVAEVQQMHKEAGHPLDVYHVGADETAGAWRDSPRCSEFIANNQAGVTDVADLGAYFIERVARMLSRRGIVIAAWGDGLEASPPQRMPNEVQVNAWRPIYAGGHSEAHDMANRRWRVIVSSPDVLYFDHPYEVDVREFGLGWASRHIDTRKVFQFMPDNLPIHAEFWRGIDGHPFRLRDRATALRSGTRFIGMQGHLWSETLRSDSRAEYMAFPRLLALAERAWYKPDWAVDYNYDGADYGPQSGVFDAKLRQQRDADWNRFANVLGFKELAKLDRAGVLYRLPTVGAVIENNRLKANTTFPGLPIEYRIDSGAWKIYQGEVEVDGKVEVRSTTAGGDRKGRSLRVD